VASTQSSVEFRRPGTKRYLAVAEKCYEGAICTIFDLVTAKTLGTLQGCRGEVVFENQSTLKITIWS